ncbi:hypothetical protein GCM10023113_20140 [Cellulomonas oligotrophica]|uniref:Uncharacterized protein n=1 Tax=Cellulomonas oligotrophica TaxID=931536 RepID=A0ABQ4DFI8_9CELL|nr:hypothetical protein Col01nite_36630 [Cellulomonas oligotrophica]
MTEPRIFAPSAVLDQVFAGGSRGLLRHLLGTEINGLLSAEADPVCGSEWISRWLTESTGATFTGTGIWTPGSGRLSSWSPSRAPGRTP